MGKAKDIRETVEAELGFDPLVDAADITVKNASGQVALNGAVPSYSQYLEAAAAAQRVAGVTDVHNHLGVVLPDSDVAVDTHGNTVTLAGHVRTWAGPTAACHPVACPRRPWRSPTRWRTSRALSPSRPVGWA